MKIPIISGKEAIRIFKKLGYKVVRQRGSHIRLRDDNNQFHKPLTIPDHKALKTRITKEFNQGF